MTDTIVAQATPFGRGGIAIVRVSGSLVKKITHAVLGCDLKPRLATYLPFRDEKNEIIDEGLALFFPGPNSFTGEDVLEFHGHGGPIIVDLLIRRILELDTRLARPGEFSERAFLNGKLDLAQAEAIADLIDASTHHAARSAMRSLQGDFSKAIHAINQKIIYLRTYVEASIDFTDEEIDFLNNGKIKNLLEEILNDLDKVQHKAKQGNFLREGIVAVIVGAPNVGKSSLLNCLSEKEVAIVTPIPGTTRDLIKETILIDGLPINIIDTAGLRETTDLIEQEGIKRAERELAQADLVLYVSDASKEQINDSLNIGSHHKIFIRNKIDLLNELPTVREENGHSVVSLSAKTKIGIDLLKNLIKTKAGFQSETDGVFLARSRHLDALRRANAHVSECLMQMTEGHFFELHAYDLHSAHQALCEITGEFTAEDLLSSIFSNFCIGK